MEAEKTFEIVKKGSWFHREYHVRTASGEKLYSISDESEGRDNRFLLKDARSREIGSVIPQFPGISYAYRAKLGDEEEKIEVGQDRWSRFIDFPKYGLKFARRGFFENYDILLNTGFRVGRIYTKANKYILSLDEPEKVVPALFLFMTMKGLDVESGRVY